MTRIAFACDSYDMLADRIASRTEDGVAKLTTRYKPKRHEELVGGSLYWIVRHRLVARSQIMRFEDAEGGRTAIVLEAQLTPVEPVPRRAHQGWRYMTVADAPKDIAELTTAGDTLPQSLTEKLAEIGLV